MSTEKELIEKLMQPRVKNIADFWNNPFKVGEVIEFDVEKKVNNWITGESEGMDWYTDFLPKDNKDVTRYMYGLRQFTPYPHLFQPMQWWEGREESEMPKYLKTLAGGSVRKVHEYGDLDRVLLFKVEGEGITPKPMREMLPATESEYLSQSTK